MRYVYIYMFRCYGGGHDEVQVGALQRGGVGEAFPEMGDEVHDATGTRLEEGYGRLGFVDR